MKDAVHMLKSGEATVWIPFRNQSVALVSQDHNRALQPSIFGMFKTSNRGTSRMIIVGTREGGIKEAVRLEQSSAGLELLSNYFS